MIKCKNFQNMDKMVKIFFTMLIILIYSVLTVQATEYHVSVSGQDENPGTKSKPFKTISAAAASTVVLDLGKVRNMAALHISLIGSMTEPNPCLIRD